uniref:Uncharacterized protein AlNc14C296G10299 n=1 Tax=Albugo laibachii Nc14 TaxID=890382 RepID=F0WVG4_9STRA|nr:conserved hypothetical protein [Albugo laibachii Nc14]|eukprot:CCA25405.1 conserved hypothetical protein [Albugo laibachii Nc14]
MMTTNGWLTGLQFASRASRTVSRSKFPPTRNVKSCRVTALKTVVQHPHSTSFHHGIRLYSKETTAETLTENQIENELRNSIRLVSTTTVTSDATNDIRNLLRRCREDHLQQNALPLCKLIVERNILTDGELLLQTMRIARGVGSKEVILGLITTLQKDPTNEIWNEGGVIAGLIHSCTRLKLFEAGLQAYKFLKKHEIQVDKSVETGMLCLSVSMNPTDNTSEIITSGQVSELTTTQLQMIVKEFLRHENSQGVIRLMEQCNMDLNAATYTKLIDVCYRKGDIDNATKFADVFYRSSAFDATLRSYNAVIQVHGRTENLARAFQLYEKMKKHQVQPSVTTLRRMLHAVYYGRYPHIDAKITKLTLLGMGVMGLGLTPFMNLQEHYLTTLFIASVLGSMGLAIYMVPNGVMRSLYPDITKPRKGDIVNAFFRRLCDEGHAGRAMYLWREMIKYNVTLDASIADIFVRVCIRKRHPEYAYNALYSPSAEFSLRNQTFQLNVTTTTHLIHSLVSQSRIPMASEVFQIAREQGTFSKIFYEEASAHRYDLAKVPSVHATSFMIAQILTTIRDKSDSNSILPRVEFTVWKAYDLLDYLDAHEPEIRALFAIDQLIPKRQKARPSHLLHDDHIDCDKLIASPLQLAAFYSRASEHYDKDTHLSTREFKH